MERVSTEVPLHTCAPLVESLWGLDSGYPATPRRLPISRLPLPLPLPRTPHSHTLTPWPPGWQLVRVNQFAQGIESTEEVVVSSVPTGAPHVYKLDLLRQVLMKELVQLRTEVLAAMRLVVKVDADIADSRRQHITITVTTRSIEVVARDGCPCDCCAVFVVREGGAGWELFGAHVTTVCVTLREP
jgi:hypothetical protein